MPQPSGGACSRVKGSLGLVPLQQRQCCRAEVGLRAPPHGSGRQNLNSKRLGVQAGAKLVQQSWDADQMITNYYKPWDTSQHSADQLFAAYKPGQTRMALLANDSLPGPLLAAELGDDIEITVNNLAQQEVTDIHWHGMPQASPGGPSGSRAVSCRRRLKKLL